MLLIINRQSEKNMSEIHGFLANTKGQMDINDVRTILGIVFIIPFLVIIGTRVVLSMVNGAGIIDGSFYEAPTNSIDLIMGLSLAFIILLFFLFVGIAAFYLRRDWPSSE